MVVVRRHYIRCFSSPHTRCTVYAIRALCVLIGVQRTSLFLDVASIWVDDVKQVIQSLDDIQIGDFQKIDDTVLSLLINY